MDTRSSAGEAPRSIRSRPRPQCPVCAGPGQIIYRGVRDGAYGASGSWDFRECRSKRCGSIWLDPVPLPQDLLLAYENYYTHRAFGGESATLAKRVYRLAADGVLHLAGVLSERRRVDGMFVENLPPGLLLDVGCGHGAFLARVSRQGWRAVGVDFDADAVEAAKSAYGLDVRVGGLDTLTEHREDFDVITASHVIEHVEDPADFLRRCRQLLRPQGRLVIRTPNVASYGHRKYRRSWRGLEPPRHLCLHTIDSLRLLANREGFEVLDCFTSHAMSEGVLAASHCLRSSGSLAVRERDPAQYAVWKLMGPMLAVGARVRWAFDKTSGEEICAVLRRKDAAVTS